MDDPIARPTQPLRLGVAVDGSELSIKALKTACQVYNGARKDTLTILHVAPFNAVARHLSQAHLKNQFTALASQARVPAGWASCEKKEAETTCQAVTALAATAGIDLLFVGSYGRKGEKLDMLGSVSDYSLRESGASVYIVHSTTAAREGSGHTYLFCTDLSRAATQAFSKLAHLIARAGKDKVVVAKLAASSSAYAVDVFAPYKALLASVKVEGECVTWPIDAHTTVAQGILSLAAAKDASCIVLGVAGLSEKLGSVSEEVSIHATCNTLVFKDCVDVAPNLATAGARTLASMVAPGSSKPSRDDSGNLARSSRPLARTSVGSLARASVGSSAGQRTPQRSSLDLQRPPARSSLDLQR